MKTIVSITIILAFALLFCCSAGLKTVLPPPTSVEPIQELPILEGPADYFTVGHRFYHNGQLRIAIHYLHKAVELEPMNARYRLFYGLTKNAIYGYQAAEPDIDMALALKQDLAGYEGLIRTYYKNYGIFCLNNGLMKKSIACFNKVVALLPDDGEVRQYLAAVYIALAKECSKGYCPVMDNHEAYNKVFTTLLD